jgi:formyltetrahydrofolate deformylase
MPECMSKTEKIYLHHSHNLFIIFFIRVYSKKGIVMAENHLTAILLLSCPDRIGLVSRISHFIFERGGNILDLDEHVDREANLFFIRITWDMAQFSISSSELDEAFTPLFKEFKAEWQIKFPDKKPKIALFVSKTDHCLQEILWRHKMGEFQAELALIISNHPDLEPLSNQYAIPFHYFPINQENKLAQEKAEIKLLRAKGVETIVLARYMQILSPQFTKAYPNQIINIHHSFLPAFVGGNPYKQAFERGVKLIGATSHYVTDALDEGPIIEQDITRITHRDSVKDLIWKGRDLERLVLARALRAHLEHRVLVYGRKTIVFD